MAEDSMGLLQEALELADEVKPLERKVFNARRSGEILSEDTPSQIQEAENKGVITGEEAEKIRAFDRKVLALLTVDDFDPNELSQKKASPEQANEKAATKKSA